MFNIVLNFPKPEKAKIKVVVVTLWLVAEE